MRLPLVLRPEAREEFDEAVQEYEGNRPGLGVEFILQVQEVFSRIAEMPESSEQIFQDVRRAVVKRFPYIILYRVETHQLVVLAVFHGRRDPMIWQKRASHPD